MGLRVQGKEPVKGFAPASTLFPTIGAERRAGERQKLPVKGRQSLFYPTEQEAWT